MCEVLVQVDLLESECVREHRDNLVCILRNLNQLSKDGACGPRSFVEAVFQELEGYIHSASTCLHLISENELNSYSLEACVGLDNFLERIDGDLQYFLDFDVQLTFDVDQKHVGHGHAEDGEPAVIHRVISFNGEDAL